jgi:hypothetical protein
VSHRSYVYQQTADVVYTPAQAAQIAAEKLKEEEKTELSAVKMLGKTTEPRQDGNGYTLIGHYSCEEDIAVEDAIPLA